MSKVPISLAVNGEHIDAEVAPRTLLVSFLRDKLGLTGTHVGCDTSQCGACTVSMNDEIVKSCTVLAVQATGADVKTIESVAYDLTLDPVQQAFMECHGLQCGFCTPGFVISVRSLLADNPNPTDEEIRHALHGNICRCTGYHNIVKAVHSAARELRAARPLELQ
ncbi:MAG: (2Fe-2S)-binding protein [Pseudomonadota bacterium]